MGQTSRCCMVCLMPQSQVSASFENPHFNMFTLDRPTSVHNRLSAFQVVQGFSEPVGRCSSVLHWRPGARVVLSTTPCEQLSPSCVDGLSAFDKALPRFQACHHSEVSIVWVHLVCSFAVSAPYDFHRSPNDWWRDSG